MAHPVWGPVAKVVVGYVVLLEVALQLIFGRLDIGPLDVGRYPNSLPRGLFLDGVVFGSLYALIAMGLILVYRANRIINFAQAQLGAVPAVLAVLLVSLKGWPYLTVIPIVLVGGALLGAGVDRVVISRFRQAPRLILTVVTIGVSFVLLVAEFAVKQAVSGDILATATAPVSTPWQDIRIAVGIYTLSGDSIFAVVVVAAVLGALAAFFRYTDLGIAVRAAAENSDRAMLLGIPVRRVSMAVWMIAATMSAIGIFLRAPLVGLSLSGFDGPSLLLYGLAVAVIARMERLPTALAAGILIGCIDRAALFATNRASLAQAVMLVVILVALLVQRSSLSRAQLGDTSSWQSVKEVRPVPAELRRLPEIRRARLLLGTGILTAVLLAPYVVGQDETGRLTQLVIYAIVGISLVVLTGWSGQISLGQFAIAGVGAAAAGGLAANHGWDFFASLAVAGLVGAGAAVVIGLPALRLQGLLLSVTTLAFAFAVQSFVLNPDFFAWLLPRDFAFVERPILYGSFDLDAPSHVLFFDVPPDAKYYYLCLVFLGLAAAMARSMRRNRSGRVVIGARDNGRLMQAFGVNLARTRLVSFALSGFLAGVAGGLFAYQQRTVDAETYTPELSILMFVMVVIGGMGSITGAILGTIYVVGIPLLPGLREIDNIELLSSGLGLLALLYFLPGGLAEAWFRLRDRYLRIVAERHGLLVPSLVADSLVTDDGSTPVEAAVETSDAAERAGSDAALIGSRT